jgi:hypothetical protein
MITGLVQAAEGRIRLQVKGRRCQEQAIEAVIDTGYTASLTLPLQDTDGRLEPGGSVRPAGGVERVTGRPFLRDRLGALAGPIAAVNFRPLDQLGRRRRPAAP